MSWVYQQRLGIIVINFLHCDVRTRFVSVNGIQCFTSSFEKTSFRYFKQLVLKLLLQIGIVFERVFDGTAQVKGTKDTHWPVVNNKSNRSGCLLSSLLTKSVNIIAWKSRRNLVRSFCFHMEVSPIWGNGFCSHIIYYTIERRQRRMQRSKLKLRLFLHAYRQSPFVL